MKKILFFLPLIIMFVTLSCNPNKTGGEGESKQTKSRMTYFEYGGYTDTIYAHISGEVYEVGEDGKLQPLSDATVEIEQIKRTTQTNEIGIFGFWLEKGVYTIVVAKDGYQPLTLTNYVSIPDQLSSTKIILEKGTEMQTVNVPDRK
ncbi:hypothetical protein M2451_001795 [Dysgonomonas sp. PFB1-18]|uniref:carboxypeptidase-like regulatory domain-containing protein n=1 Tax=unclassified Dysgonomonas TaxID=2630389 RepID=UPI0024764E58|nr:MULTISPECIES: carboxypeptidase-like regulatory domain-containing protein [unclassified Dysgonomonas]MDH6309224.1 hypothetical protein [Dysgonomonas sp. PF1-14]MDH6338896.1 hypothetical protein [Dysgonomonas sp. PF1-16]MDH6380473.1 hypothetical protein [Dysgonomonas sp. PFB1-18]MDH6397724.1 hypothetical protein [Dysgonomonas sp. PF1-23]